MTAVVFGRGAPPDAGVTNYLTEPAVAAVLSFIGRYAPGSTVVFTYELRVRNPGETPRDEHRFRCPGREPGRARAHHGPD